MNLSCSVLTTSLGYWTISQGYDDLPRVLDDHLEVLNDLLGVLDDLPGVLGNKGYLHYQRELWRNIFGKNTIYYWRKTRKCDILREQESINAPPPLFPAPFLWRPQPCGGWHSPYIRFSSMPSLLNDLGRHPVRRALHRTKDVASTHAEILKQNHEPQRSGFYYVFHCAFAQYVGYPTCN